MKVTHNVNLEARTGDINRYFQKARKKFLAGDDYALVSFQAEFPENEYVQQLVQRVSRERSEIEYRVWLADMNDESGC